MKRILTALAGALLLLSLACGGGQGGQSDSGPSVAPRTLKFTQDAKAYMGADTNFHDYAVPIFLEFDPGGHTDTVWPVCVKLSQSDPKPPINYDNVRVANQDTDPTACFANKSVSDNPYHPEWGVIVARPKKDAVLNIIIPGTGKLFATVTVGGEEVTAEIDINVPEGVSMKTDQDQAVPE